MTTEPSTHRGFGNSVEPFRVKRLRRESPGIPDVRDECPDFQRGRFHVNCHCSMHGQIVASCPDLPLESASGLTRAFSIGWGLGDYKGNNLADYRA